MEEKVISNGQVIRILKTLIEFDKEVATWTNENIDFNRYKNKLQTLKKI